MSQTVDGHAPVDGRASLDSRDTLTSTSPAISDCHEVVRMGGLQNVQLVKLFNTWRAVLGAMHDSPKEAQQMSKNSSADKT